MTGITRKQRVRQNIDRLLDSQYKATAESYLDYLTAQLNDPDVVRLREAFLKRYYNDWDDTDETKMPEYITYREAVVSAWVGSADTAGQAAFAAGYEAQVIAEREAMREAFGVDNPDDATLASYEFNRVDPQTITAAGSYAFRIQEYVKDSSDDFRYKFMDQLLKGKGPIATARVLREDLPGLAAYRVNNLIRTAQIMSYREQTRLVSAANRQFYDYQIRVSSRDSRTCLACLALHGQRLEPAAQIIDHHSGRCRGIIVPIGRPAPEVETGEQIWERLTLDQKYRMAGDWAAINAIDSGRLKLSDFVGTYEDSIFGTMLRRRSLIDILGPSEAPKFYGYKTPAQIEKMGAARQPYTGNLAGAKSVEDIRDYWRAKYPSIDFNFAVTDNVSGVRQIVYELEGLVNDYPQAARYLRGVGTQGDYKEDRNVVATASRSGRIWFNRDYLNNPDFRALTTPAYAKDKPGIWAVQDTTGLRAVTTHEFGHILHYALQSDRQSLLSRITASGMGTRAEILSRWLDVFKPRKNTVSDYAMTNQYEWFTESFTARRYVNRKDWNTHLKRFDKLMNLITDESRPTYSNALRPRPQTMDEIEQLQAELQALLDELGLSETERRQFY